MWFDVMCRGVCVLGHDGAGERNRIVELIVLSGAQCSNLVWDVCAFPLLFAFRYFSVSAVHTVEQKIVEFERAQLCSDRPSQHQVRRVYVAVNYMSGYDLMCGKDRALNHQPRWCATWVAGWLNSDDGKQRMSTVNSAATNNNLRFTI